MPHKQNYLSLDPTYKDAYGLPLMQLTYNFTGQDRALHKYISARAADIMKEMGAKQSSLTRKLPIIISYLTKQRITLVER